MRILPPDAEGIAAALEILRSGGIVAHATETCYGLACDVSSAEVVAKLFALKQRPPDQPISVLFVSIDDAKRYVEWNEEAEKVAKKYLPGPLTIILPLKSKPLKQLRVTSDELRETRNPKPATIGVRISSYPLAQRLVREFGSPLSTTSANFHGESNTYSVEDIVDQFSQKPLRPNLILDSGPLPPTPPSTVIDLTVTTIRIRRRGVSKCKRLDTFSPLKETNSRSSPSLWKILPCLAKAQNGSLRVLIRMQHLQCPLEMWRHCQRL